MQSQPRKGKNIHYEARFQVPVLLDSAKNEHDWTYFSPPKGRHAIKPIKHMVPLNSSKLIISIELLHNIQHLQRDFIQIQL